MLKDFLTKELLYQLRFFLKSLDRHWKRHILELFLLCYSSLYKVKSYERWQREKPGSHSYPNRTFEKPPIAKIPRPPYGQKISNAAIGFYVLKNMLTKVVENFRNLSETREMRLVPQQDTVTSAPMAQVARFYICWNPTNTCFVTLLWVQLWPARPAV